MPSGLFWRAARRQAVMRARGTPREAAAKELHRRLGEDARREALARKKAKLDQLDVRSQRRAPLSLSAPS
jgi:hypothetical protein